MAMHSEMYRMVAEAEAEAKRRQEEEARRRAFDEYQQRYDEARERLRIREEARRGFRQVEEWAAHPHCWSCKGEVPAGRKAGDKCPHCGVGLLPF